MASKSGSVLRGSGLGSVFKSLTNSLKPASGNVPVVINAKVVGGGNDMQRLLLQLQHGTLPSRASAAQEVTDQLEKYSISSIPEVWYLARDLCDYKVQSSIRRVVLKLMIQCIIQDETAISNNLMFFRDITQYCKLDSRLDPEFDLFWKALRTLTKDGRDIHDLYIQDAEDNWGSFVLRCLTVASKFAKDFSGDEKPDDKNFHNLLKILQYLTHCFKYNFGIFDEHFVASVLASILRMADQTDNVELMSAFIEFIKVCAQYGYIPSEYLNGTVQFLCWASTTSEEIQGASWGALKILCLENPSSIILSMCSVLHDPTLQLQQGLSNTLLEEIPTQGTFNSPLAVAVGSMTLLANIFICIRSDKLCLEINREDIIPIFQECLELGVPLVNSGLLRMFDKLFDPQNYESLYLKDIKFTVLFPFQSWYSSSTSMFLLLSAFKINSLQDESYWVSICSSLHKQYQNLELVAPKERMVQLFMKHKCRVPEEIVTFVLLFYEEEQACTVLDPLWKENCRDLLNNYYFPNESTNHLPKVRMECLKTIKDGFEISRSLLDDYSVSKEIIIEIILRSVAEHDQSIIDFIMEEYILHFLQTSSMAFTMSIIAALTPLLQVKQQKERIMSISSLGSFGSGPQKPLLSSINSTGDVRDSTPSLNSQYLVSLAKCLSKTLLVVHSKNAEKAKVIYDFIIDMVHYTMKLDLHQIVLILLRVLVRLRSTVEGYVYFTVPTDVGGLAITFKRNTTGGNPDLQNAWWTVPENLDYLPSEYSDQPNKNWLVFDPEGSKLSIDNGTHLDVAKWFQIVIAILEEYHHWELYSYIWTHFCSQLSNMKLFAGQTTLIRRLQKIVCDQLNLNLPRPLMLAKSIPIAKANLQVACIRTMSSLIGYHEVFRKAEEDQIVSSLHFAMDSFEKTAIPCIHILTVCCFELPMSLKKYLTAILTRIQAGVTSAFASSPTLEFLMSLIQVPELTSNFTIDEFKRVFAIAFKYIQYASDIKSRKGKFTAAEQKSLVLGHGVDAEVDNQASTQATEITPIINEYLLSVSYLVISRWFLKIKLTDRRQVSGFLIKNIILCSGSKDGKALDDRTVAFLDLVARFTYCDIPLKITTMSKVSTLNPHTMTNRWIIGHSIVSIDTNTSNGESVIALRRPTGASIFKVELDPTMLSKTFHLTDGLPNVLSSYFLLQLLRPLDEGNSTKPIPLFEDTATERAINTFDRIPVVSHHKAGVLYIGPDQKTETEILGNTVGSAAYHKFLDGIGTLVRLNDDLSSYTGGLDRENGTDGEYAYIWSDHFWQLVYHTTTLMPNMVNDKFHAMKKRHIGNNHINVFWDESGLPFNFNVIKSQFNFINIVISPHTFKNSPMGSAPAEFYKVRAYRRSGVPGIFSSTHFKLVSLDQLLHYVRNMVLMADRFAHVWHYALDGNYTMNWALRVKHIATLKQKTQEAHRNLHNEQIRQDTSGSAGLGAGEAPGSDMTQSFLQQLQATATPPATIALGASKYDYVASDDNELYSLLEFNSYA